MTRRLTASLVLIATLTAITALGVPLIAFVWSAL
jgi:hypothetical protein